MALEIYVYAPNAEKDRERITLMFQNDGYHVVDMQLQIFPESLETYFKATVEQSDTFIQD
jgi:hypothetical protein